MIRKVWHINFVFAWLIATAGSPAEIYHCGNLPAGSGNSGEAVDCYSAGYRGCNMHFCNITFDYVLMPGNCHHTTSGTIKQKPFIPPTSNYEIHIPVSESLFMEYPSDIFYTPRITGPVHNVEPGHGLQNSNHAVPPFLQVFLF